MYIMYPFRIHSYKSDYICVYNDRILIINSEHIILIYYILLCNYVYNAFAAKGIIRNGINHYQDFSLASFFKQMRSN